MGCVNQSGQDGEKGGVGRRGFGYREFLKVEALAAWVGALMLAGCGRVLDDEATTSQIGFGSGVPEEKFFPTETPSDGSESELVVVEGLGESIWQVGVGSGGPMEAVSQVRDGEGRPTTWDMWSGFGAIVAVPSTTNESGWQVMHFTGERGGGKQAMLIMSALYEGGALSAENPLALFDFRTLPEGTQMIFGKTDVVGENLERLLGSGGKMEKLLSYPTAMYETTGSYETGDLKAQLYIFRQVRDGGNWRHETILNMERKFDGSTWGGWESVDGRGKGERGVRK